MALPAEAFAGTNWRDNRTRLVGGQGEEEVQEASVLNDPAQQPAGRR